MLRGVARDRGRRLNVRATTTRCERSARCAAPRGAGIVRFAHFYKIKEVKIEDIFEEKYYAAAHVSGFVIVFKVHSKLTIKVAS